MYSLISYIYSKTKNRDFQKSRFEIYNTADDV